LVGSKSNAAAIGARVEVYAGALIQSDEVRSGSSFLSQSDLRLHFGLGDAKGVEKAVVYWPSGLVEEFASIAVDKETLLREGSGQ
jgi:hypothetical protein